MGAPRDESRALADGLCSGASLMHTTWIYWHAAAGCARCERCGALGMEECRHGSGSSIVPFPNHSCLCAELQNAFLQPRGSPSWQDAPCSPRLPARLLPRVAAALGVPHLLPILSPPSKAPSFGSATLCMSPWAVERWVTPAPPATSRASPRGSRARLAKHKLWDAPRFPLPYGTGGSADAVRFGAAARAVHGAEGAAGRGRLQRRSCSPRAPVNQQLCVRSGGEKHPAGSTLPVPVPGCS